MYKSMVSPWEFGAGGGSLALGGALWRWGGHFGAGGGTLALGGAPWEWKMQFRAEQDIVEP
jgi:hypothetical protein